MSQRSLSTSPAPSRAEQRRSSIDSGRSSASPSKAFLSLSQLKSFSLHFPLFLSQNCSLSLSFSLASTYGRWPVFNIPASNELPRRLAQLGGG